MSLLTALALCLSLLPATAWAEDGESVTYLTWDEDQGKLVTATCNSYTSLTSSSYIFSLGTEGQPKWYVLTEDNSPRFRIEVKGDVHLILSNNCTLTAQQGIHVPDGSSLTIYAQSENESEMGKLVAEPGDDYLTYRWCAVIGGNGTDTAGSITINGGNITATGKVSYNGAYGAAIGTGCYSKSGSTDSTMAITINGGIVTAEASGGGAAIGTGYRTGGGTITINGGTINATSNGAGAAIGTGYSGTGGTVTINGGTVKATSNDSGAAIGVGDSGTLGTVTITGGQITAAAYNKKGNPSNSGAAIGCGYFYSTGGKINISGGTINITDGYQNGIGYGHLKSSTGGSSSITININGGSICSHASRRSGRTGGTNSPCGSRGSGRTSCSRCSRGSGGTGGTGGSRCSCGAGGSGGSWCSRGSGGSGGSRRSRRAGGTGGSRCSCGSGGASGSHGACRTGHRAYPLTRYAAI